MFDEGAFEGRARLSPTASARSGAGDGFSWRADRIHAALRKGISMTTRLHLLLLALLVSVGLLPQLTAHFSAGHLWAGDQLTAAPTQQDREIVRTLTGMLANHLSGAELDDVKSFRTFETFIKILDPAKSYFLESDVATLRAQQHELDDQLRARDPSFAFDALRLFMQRAEERLPMIDELLALEHDFTVDEEIVRDADDLDFPADVAEARERWRKRVKYDLLFETTDGVDLEEAREKLSRRYHRFVRRMGQIDNTELLEMYLTALTTSYDPHSSYMSAHSYENLKIALSLSLEGIGAVLTTEDGYTTVREIVPGGAADLDGRLMPGDRISAVGQEDSEELVDVVEWKISDVVPMIRGKPGTQVRLLVLPKAGGERRTYELTRARIELTESEASGQVFDVSTKDDGAPYRVGVIDLPSFYRDMDRALINPEDFRSTTRDVRKILNGFSEQSVDAVVLDLRRNGGGSLTEAVDLTGLFIDRGPVVQVKSFDGSVRKLSDTERGVAWGGPLVVLTSKFSASASEILAGAIQDYGRGLVVGDPATHGKGSVQTLLDLDGRVKGAVEKLGALKLTLQQFYRPSGDSTQNIGVRADVVLPSLTAHIALSEGDLDYAMAFDTIAPASVAAVDLVTPALVDKVRAQSAARVAACPDFQKLERRIELYRQFKDRRTLTLHREKYLAQRAELDAEKEEEKLAESLVENSKGPGDGIERDFYLDEALQIAVDVVRARPQLVVK